ncbi:MAG: hypothetical protein LBU38_01785 [Propionibacteriaceae bacterium]|jgi:hypothetical protein|nr:hypothetical protein [Propionibacteriaceae bacterium]
MELLGTLPVVGAEPVLGLHDRLIHVFEGVLDLPVLGEDDLGEERLVASLADDNAAQRGPRCRFIKRISGGGR